MPVHRIKKESGTSGATFGAGAQTAGITFNTAGVVATRNALPGSLVTCSDGTLVYGFADGIWGTKTITDNTATSIVDVACAASASIGGIISYLLEFNDGTDFQALMGQVAYAGVNKAGTHTLTVSPVNAATNQTTVSGCDAKAVSGGTLVITAWTIVTGTNKATIKIQAVGSLTETVIRITYFVMPFRGVVTNV